MPDIEIRLAQRDDLAAIIELLQQGSLESPLPHAGLSEGHIAAFATITAHPDNELVVATLDEEIVATLQLTFIPGLSSEGAWRAQIEGVRVREDLRGQRIGTHLMEWVIRRARDRNCRLIQLTTNLARVDARRFYERLGFTASHMGMKLFLR
jgi:GNAT superfamily N-acetyltransferase